MIPVIDLGPYLAARPGADAAAAAEIGRALTHVGFFVVVNHGISTTPSPRPAAFTPSPWTPSSRCA
jgi:isopenicillin N synthase-like dioxygenase